MQTLIEYLQNNPNYVSVLCIFLAASVLIFIAIVIVRKKFINNVDLKNVSQDSDTTRALNDADLKENEIKTDDNPENHDVATNDVTIDEQGKIDLSDSQVTNDENTTDSSIKSENPVIFDAENKNANTEKPDENKTTIKSVKKQDEIAKNSDDKSNENVVNSKSKSNETADGDDLNSTEKHDDEQSAVNMRYAGKWVIYQDELGRYVADLKASNGEKMLTTESYTSLSGIKSGIDTLKKNIANENYAIYLDKNGNYAFKIFSTANRLLCVGEGYSTKEQCKSAFLSVMRFSKNAVIVNQSNPKAE